MSVTSLLKKAVEKHEKKDYAEAEKLYRQILSAHPRHLDAHYLLGTMYGECGEYASAREHLVKASRIDPSSAMVQVNLGNVFRKLGSLDLAVNCFTRAIKLAPKMFQAHLGLGSALLELDEEFEKVADCFEKAFELAPKVPEIYHQMGMLYAKKSMSTEALQLLEATRKMNPEFPDIDLDLGLTSLRAGAKDKAASYFRDAVFRDPGNTKAAFFLAVAEGRMPDDQLSQQYAQVVFDDYAATFEKHLVGNLQYGLPRRVVETLKRVCGEDCRFNSAVDLGCGTGLTGEALRSATARLTGIDISEKMLEVAKGKRCFDELLCGDLVAVLASRQSRFDLFVATDVMVCIGKFDALLPIVVSKALPGALFLFSTEKLDGEGVALQTSGRYAHSPSYVREVMRARGCEVINEEEIDLRMEGGSWLKGNIFVVRVAPAAS